MREILLTASSLIFNALEDEENGDAICSCGLVLRARIVDKGKDWRSFNESDKDRARTSPVDSPGHLSTWIAGTGDFGQSGQLAKNNYRIQIDSKRRNLNDAHQMIEHFAESMRLTPELKNRARYVYSKYEELRAKTMRKGNNPGLIAAIIYLACKDLHVGRSFREISRGTGVGEKEVRKFKRKVEKLLKESGGAGNVNLITSVKPHELVERFCDRLRLAQGRLPSVVKFGAIKISKESMEKLEGRQPGSIACAAILMATKVAGIVCSDKDIANVAKISPTTVRSVYKRLKPFQSILVPKSLVDYAQQCAEANSTPMLLESTTTDFSMPSPSPMPSPTVLSPTTGAAIYSPLVTGAGVMHRIPHTTATSMVN